jgi:AcrR family transcriptional regulator
MSPRPRKATDEAIFTATHRIMSRLGPAQWTLQNVAAEAGLTAGALVQRFGSKRGLLVSLTARAAEATGDCFAELEAATSSPLAALRAYGSSIARMGESPAALAHHLAYLQLDLTDPDLHRHVRAQARATRAALQKMLDRAVAAGELQASPGGVIDTAALARAVEVALSGSLMTWAFHQDGPAAKWVRHDLEAVLRPFLTRPRRKRKKAGAARKRGRRRSKTGD